jgi:cyclopropane fatty-acyl-phospholipid synthase-like methyltransferase
MESSIPMPSDEYQQFVCGPTPEDTRAFESVGRTLMTMLSQVGMLTPTTDLLDVGCGCGRLARYLTDSTLHSYIGFDRHPGMVRWCQQEISARDSRFTFHHFDIQSVYAHWDQQNGNISAAEFTFPYEDGQFNAVMLASVFTHMPLEEIGQYLKEFQRIVKPDGKILLSVFFSDREYYVDQTINFFYRPEEFLTLVEATGFFARLMIPGAGGLVPSEQTLQTGYAHNWYLLEPNSADGVR